jgi:hypothetical protein
VCREVQKNDKLLRFKEKVQHELRDRYRCAIGTYEELLRSTR